MRSLTFRLYVLAVLLVAGCGGGITANKVMDYDGLVLSGWQKYNMYEYDEAYQLFCEAREFDTERAGAYIGCGWTQLRRQKPDSAVVAFKFSFDRITTLEDSVDAITGLAGSYLATGNNNGVLDLFETYTVSSFADAYPLEQHDFFLDEDHLSMVRATACYRKGDYSPDEKADPDNAVFHFNDVLDEPYEYTTPAALMKDMTTFLEDKGGNLY